MALPSIEQISANINGVTVQCSHIVCPDSTNFRMEDVLEVVSGGYFTWQTIAKSADPKNIIVIVGNVEAILNLTTTWTKFIQVYEGVDPTINKDVNIFFPAGEYWLYHTMLEKGNKASDWSASPEDTEEELRQIYIEIREQYTQIMSDTEQILLEAISNYVKISDFETFQHENAAALQIKADEILSTVSETYTTKSESANLQSQISQNAQGIQSKVSQTDFQNGNTITSIINQTSDQIKIKANRVEIDGNIVLKSNLKDGVTEISGNNITTGTINANRIDAHSLTADKLTGKITDNATKPTWEIDFDTGKIKIGTVTADNIDTENLKVKAANITGTLKAENIEANSINVNKLNGTISNGNWKITLGTNPQFEIGQVGTSNITDSAVNIDKLSNETKQTLVKSSIPQTQYYLSSSNTTTQNGSWLDTMPTWQSGKYIWTREKIVTTYANNEVQVTYQTAKYDKNLTTALSTASGAQSTATSANTAAANAQSTANAANTAAGKAQTTANSAQTAAANAQATADSAQTAAANAQSSANSAAVKEQIVYRSQPVNTASINPPSTSTWITDVSGKQNTWTIKRPQYDKDFPVLFISVQRQYVNGTITCTTPMIDQTTTIIDGGHIISGTITANQIATNTISLNRLTAEAQKSLVKSSYSETEYYLSTSSSSATGGTWSTNIPTWASNKYIWTREKTIMTYIDNTTSSTYKPSENGAYDKNLTTALSTASGAQSTANAANTAATNAQSTADTANTAASQAQSTANAANTAAGKAQTTANTANTAAANAQSTANAANTAATNAQTSANGAVSKQQTIYFAASLGTTSKNAPTTWVTDTSGGTNKWTTIRPEYIKDFPVLFIATQKQTVGGTLTCTTPAIDKTTTVIDGGNIITGSITAGQIATNTITLDRLTTETKSSLIKSSYSETEYYLSTSSSSTTSGSWSTTVPTWASGKYIWTREKTTVTYANDTTSSTYKPSENGVYDKNLTTALSTASGAQSTATTAKNTADTAKSTADTAKSTADTAQSTATTAKNTADTAKSTATTAKNTADTAKSTADTAKSTADTAKSTADTAKTAANSAISKQQIIYFAADINTTSKNAPNSWVTDISGKTNKWTTVRPEYTQDFPVLFIATQSQTVGGTLACTTPSRDKTTTVIDGGNIITNTINADCIAAGKITAAVEASNFKMTGGSINISTNNDSFDFISLNASNGSDKMTVDMYPLGFDLYSKSGSIVERAEYRAGGISFGTTETDGIFTGYSFVYKDASGNDTARIMASTGKATFKDLEVNGMNVRSAINAAQSTANNAWNYLVDHPVPSWSASNETSTTYSFKSRLQALINTKFSDSSSSPTYFVSLAQCHKFDKLVIIHFQIEMKKISSTDAARRQFNISLNTSRYTSLQPETKATCALSSRHGGNAAIFINPTENVLEFRFPSISSLISGGDYNYYGTLIYRSKNTTAVPNLFY